MSSSIGHQPFLLDRMRRLCRDKIVPALVMVVFIAAVQINMGSSVTSAAPIIKPKVEEPAAEQHQVMSPRLPSNPTHAKAQLHRRWMTEAMMTSHNLTAAYFVDRQEIEKLSAETQDSANQG